MVSTNSSVPSKDWVVVSLIHYLARQYMSLTINIHTILATCLLYNIYFCKLSRQGLRLRLLRFKPVRYVFSFSIDLISFLLSISLPVTLMGRIMKTLFWCCIFIFHCNGYGSNTNVRNSESHLFCLFCYIYYDYKTSFTLKKKASIDLI